MQATVTGIQAGTSTETSKLLTKILNTFYTSGIDRIKTYGKTPNGNIVGEFIADGMSFQYVLNMKTNTISYGPVGNRTASKADSLLAEQENADRFKAIYSVREAFEVSDASVIKQKLDSWFFHADAPAKAKVGVKAKANKSGKTLTCTPGKTYPCGAVCRAFGTDCRQKMSPEVQEMVRQFAAKLKTPTAAALSVTPQTVEAKTITSPPKERPSNRKVLDNTSLMNIYLDEITCEGKDCTKTDGTDDDALIVDNINLNPIIIQEIGEDKYKVIANHAVYARMRKSETASCIVVGKNNKTYEKKISEMKSITQTAVATTAPKTKGITAQKLAEQIAAAKALEPDTPKEKPKMDKLKTTLVAIKRVTPPIQEFDQDELMSAAESILKTGGFIEPPVLRRKNDSFEIISGEFQVAAAIVAKAIKPLSGETLPSIVIDEENEEAIMSQVNLIKKQQAR